MGCPTSYYYDITSSTGYHLPANGTYLNDGPGGTITVSVTQSSTITATATVSAGASLSGIVASAKVEVSASISQSTAVTVGHTYSHNVSANRYGNMQYGSWGYQVGWRCYFENANCGTGLGPGLDVRAAARSRPGSA